MAAELPWYGREGWRISRYFPSLLQADTLKFALVFAIFVLNFDNFALKGKLKS